MPILKRWKMLIAMYELRLVAAFQNLKMLKARVFKRIAFMKKMQVVVMQVVCWKRMKKINRSNTGIHFQDFMIFTWMEK